jgi:hypothetical protein
MLTVLGYSRMSPTISPARPTIVPRNRRNDLVSGRLESLGGGQSTNSASAINTAPSATSSFQRNAMACMILLNRALVDRLSTSSSH